MKLEKVERFIPNEKYICIKSYEEHIEMLDPEYTTVIKNEICEFIVNNIGIGYFRRPNGKITHIMGKTAFKIFRKYNKEGGY